MPTFTFSEAIIGALKIMQTFPLIPVVFIFILCLLINHLIKNLRKENSVEGRIKKVAYFLLFAILSPAACYLFVIALFPFFK